MRMLPALVAASITAACGVATAQSGSAPSSHGTASPAADQAPAQQRSAGTSKQGDRQGAGWVEADREFVENAAQSGLAELRASKMAQERSKNPKVRQFAQRMVQDHTAANQRLAKLARAGGVKMPTEPSLLQRGKLELVEHSGDGFDARFIDHLGIDAHKNAIELFERQVQAGRDPGLVQFARETLPKLQDHLRMARDLQNSLQAGADQRGQGSRDATGAAGAEGRPETRTLGNAGSAVQSQSARVSDTGVAPPAVDRRTPGTPAEPKR